MNISLTITIAVVGSCLALVGSLIVLNLRAIKGCIRSFTTRVDKVEDKQAMLNKDFQSCKVDCEREFTSKELFLRETGYARQTLEKLNASVSNLDGKLTVVEKLPQICGDISREIVREMNNGAHNGQRPRSS
jgi:hypothetical protein